MRAVLKSGQPLIVGYDVYPDFMAYAGVQGVYGGQIANVGKNDKDANGKKLVNGHAVFVVGYNNPTLKSNASPTWILQNSWKPTWGKNGLMDLEMIFNGNKTSDVEEKSAPVKNFSATNFTPPIRTSLPNAPATSNQPGMFGPEVAGNYSSLDELLQFFGNK